MSPLLVAWDWTQRVAHVHPSFPGHCWATGTASWFLPQDLPSPLITRGSTFPTGFTLSCEIPAVVAPSASWLPPPTVAMDTSDPHWSSVLGAGPPGTTPTRRPRSEATLCTGEREGGAGRKWKGHLAKALFRWQLTHCIMGLVVLWLPC